MNVPAQERLVIYLMYQKGYTISDDHYLYDSSEGVFTISWAFGKE